MFHSVRSRIAATFIAALVALMVVLSVAAFSFLHWYEHGKTDERGMAASQTAAAMFGYAENNDTDFTNNEEYERFRTVLRRVCIEYDMAYLYAYECDIENNKITYLTCVAADDRDDAVVKRIHGYGAVTPRQFSEVELDALNGLSPTKAIVFDNAFGYTLDWVSLVKGRGKNVLAGASYSVTAQRMRVIRSTLAVLIPFALSLLITFLIQLSVMRRYLFDPISMIATRMRTFSADDASSFEPIDIRSNDEMGEIADAFSTMANKIAEYIGNIEQLTQERVQNDVELDIARRIQFGIVPNSTERAGAGFDASALSRPARAVGGDFYDVFELDDGRIAAVVGDVSGKGVAAALFMVLTRTMIRDALKAGQKPAEALEHANDNLCTQNPEGMFVTVFACTFRPTTGELRYANAGHMLPIMIGASGAHLLEADLGVLLGLFDDVELQEGTIGLEPGQTILIYTDGATEAVSADKKFLGTETFVEQLAVDCPYESASQVVDAASHIVDVFTEECEQFDDLTLVALMHSPGHDEGGILEGAIEVASDMSSLTPIREAVFSTQTNDALKRKACLVCEEVFVNVVSYSDATRIWYQVESNQDDWLRITLADDGSEFDLTAAEPNEQDFEDLENGGMGIDLVLQLVSDISYQRTGDRNILVFEVTD